MNKKILGLASLLTASGIAFGASSSSSVVGSINNSSSSISSQSILSGSFTQAKNCSQVESYVSDILSKKNQQKINSMANSYMMEDRAVGASAVADMAFGDSNTASLKVSGTASASPSVSSTNVQVEGVDEADIIKNDGENWYFYNSRLGLINIFSIKNGKANLISTIESKTSGVQMFISEKKLILIADSNQYSYERGIWGGSNYETNIKTYDIQDIKNPKLVGDYTLPGEYKESRMIGSVLTLVSSKNNYVYSVQPTYKLQKTDYALSIKNGLTSGNIDIGCENIYLPPVQDENFDRTLITTIDTKDQKISSTKLIYGGYDTMYMSNKNLYIATSEEKYTPCSSILGKCIDSATYTYNTKITKFGVDGTFKNDFVVSGKLSNQYFLDEDENENLRVITTSGGWGESRSSNLFVVAKDGKIIGSIEGIAKGEDVKSVRFFGSKAFFVTYYQIDPLFVVELADPKNPKIIGELKIPGYSSYLHPYGLASGNVQYLIGFGTNTADNGYGGEKADGLKLSFYQIDYSKKETADSKCGKLLDIKQKNTCLTQVNTGNIFVQELDSKNLGGYGSKSEALDNPRNFIFDTKNNNLFLPLVLSKQVKGKSCSYFSLDGKPVESDIDCRDDTKYITDFVGIKGYNISPAGIRENLSSSVQKTLRTVKKTNSYYYNDSNKWYNDSPYNYSNLNARVGYDGDYAFYINDYLINIASKNSSGSNTKLLDSPKSLNKIDETSYTTVSNTPKTNTSSVIVDTTTQNFVQGVVIN